MKVMTLSEFLMARIAEDEGVARKAVNSVHSDYEESAG